MSEESSVELEGRERTRSRQRDTALDHPPCYLLSWQRLKACSEASTSSSSDKCEERITE